MNRVPKAVRAICAVSCAAVLLLSSLAESHNIMASAEVSLPEGTAAGLPEKLSVLDSDGNSVSDTGEYFFYVEDMQAGTAYSKDIQITNLREDKAYHIYMYAEPIAKSGDIDLENNCTAVFTLGGEEVYTGLVTGVGNINMQNEALDLGLYKPGESGTLNVSVTWNGSLPDNFYDNGERLIDASGETIIREASGTNYVEGEVTFRWIFYAAVDEDYVPPNTGFLSAEKITYIVLFIIALIGIMILLLLIVRKRRRDKNEKSGRSGADRCAA